MTKKDFLFCFKKPAQRKENVLRNQLKEKRDQGDFTWYIDYKAAHCKRRETQSQEWTNKYTT